MPTYYTHHLQLRNPDDNGTVPAHALIADLAERTVGVLMRWDGALPGTNQSIYSKGVSQKFSAISTGEGYDFYPSAVGSQRWRGPALNNATPLLWRWVFNTSARAATNIAKRFTAVKDGTILEQALSDEFGGTGLLGADNTFPFVLGRSPSNGAFKSDIAFIGVWDRRLTATECQEVVSDLNLATRQPIAAWKPRATSVGAIANFVPSGVSMLLGNNSFLPAPTVASGPDTQPPTIVSFTPMLGVPTSTINVSIEDTGTITSAAINGISATFVQPDSLNVIVTVPVGAGSGRITLVSALGTATSVADFTIPVPTITGFGPDSGIEGTPIVVGLAYTDTVAAVSLGGVGAVFTRPSAASLLLYVPAGAVTGQIVVEASNGTAISALPFTVIAPQVNIRDVQGATFLDAVNSIMRSVGESALENLEDLPADGKAAVEILKQGLRELALRPWEFNYDRNVKFLPEGFLADTLGVERSVFIVPDNVASAVATVREGQTGPNTPDVSMRRARTFLTSGIRPRVFANRVGGEDGFEGRSVLYMDVTRFIPFEDLPEVAKNYITIRSARRYASEVMGSGELTSFKQSDEQHAWIELESQFGIQEHYNLFEAYENAPLSRARNLNTGWTS
jgi:hypothetical protein